MKILVTHSSNFDFEEKLYKPIRGSQLYKEHEIIFPQDGGERKEITPETIKSRDLILAEVSLPSTGQGIELGQAQIFDVPVICVHEEGADISTSLDKVANTYISYKSSDDMLSKVTKELSS
jgi:hypothetical protein